jgi:pimeloyl-ACP methyl ester carboxylesterase
MPASSKVPVLSIDLPGFGASAPLKQPSMRAYAEAAFSVLEELEIDKCVIIGHSLGGYVALEMLALYSEKIAGMGLFHSHPFPDSEERKQARQRGIEMLHSGKRDLYVAQLFPNLFSAAFAKARPEVVQALIANGKRQSPEGISHALQSMMERRDQQLTLETAGCPVLFILGTEDGLLPLEQAWKAAVKPATASVEVLSGVAHMGMFEAPEECGAAVERFYGLCVGGMR